MAQFYAKMKQKDPSPEFEVELKGCATILNKNIQSKDQLRIENDKYVFQATDIDCMYSERMCTTTEEHWGFHIQSHVREEIIFECSYLI